MGSVVTRVLEKQMYESLWNLVMSPSIDFMPPDQICHMSVNGLKRQVATRNKTQNRTRMGELSIALDPEYRV